MSANTDPKPTSPPPVRPSDAGASGQLGPKEAERPLNFIRQMVEADGAARKWGEWTAADAARPGAGQVAGTPRVHTRFPPEPNGYLHIGHAKSICVNFGLAKAYGGLFNLRFDDTNPAKEEQEYVDSIKADVRWLGADWDGPFGGGIYWSSDYFQKMYEFAEELIGKGLAYVCDLTGEQVAEFRGPPNRPGKPSPFRDRGAAESLVLFRAMRAGEFATGAKTLRAKIDMSSPNINLRDPIMYRILHEEHHNTGKMWCIYPMYDWAHGFEDSIEGITHSICTLEFENHRPLYDWFIRSVNQGRADGDKIHHAQQIEFSKLRPTYTVLSKRNLLKMVEEQMVSGWDDPRMPTLSGLRRRGYTPESLVAFCEDVGLTKVESFIDLGRLENAIREHLNKTAPRAMAVLRPLEVVIENWPEGKVDELDFVVNPEDPSAGVRKVPFSRVIYIEREDFMEEPPKKFFRLAPGQEVRLRWAYFITCTGLTKDAAGNITQVRATYDPATRGGDAPVGPDGKPTKKVKGTLHWVSAAHAISAEVRLFDRLFGAEHPGERTGNAFDELNPGSREVVKALIEPHLVKGAVGERVQFERLGYFCVDRDSAPGAMVFNRTVTLKDGWAKDAGKA